MDTAERARAAFVRYRELREPADLSSVFDACAQELLLVAHHIARPGVAPEDLLQSTFLEAIRAAEHYDAQRPLMPWLCGILVNVARTQGRLQERTYEPDQLHYARTDDPTELAYAREFAEAVAAALADFPARQREVLNLRLVHGLTPTEIAHALGAPVGSVKSWIHRGIERLRNVLPVGFAASLACLVKAESSLDALRAEVLRRAAACVPHGDVRVPRSLMRIASRPIVVAVFACTLALIAVFATRNAPVERRFDSQAGAPRDVGVAGPIKLPQDNELDVRAAVASATDAEAATGLVLSVRFGGDGAPAEVVVRLEPRFGVDAQLRAQTLRTNAAGEARVIDLEAGPYEVLVDRGEPDVLEYDGVSGRFELELTPGDDIEGRVLDSAGAPVSGASIWLSRHQRFDEGEFVTTTDQLGRFRVRDVPPGRVLAAFADGWHCSALRSADPDYGRSAASGIELRLTERAAAVRGRVVDQRGEPVAQAHVSFGAAFDPRWSAAALESHGRGPPQLAVSDAHGEFECRTLGAEASIPVWVRAAGMAGTVSQLSAVRAVTTELEFMLDRGATWTGTVVYDDASSGPAGLIATAREVGAQGANDRPPRWLRSTAIVELGEPFQLTGLGTGAVVLRAMLPNARSVQREVELRAEGRVEWSPDLRASNALHGRVIAAPGVDLALYRVRVSSEHASTRWIELDGAGAFVVERGTEAALDISLHAREPAFDGVLALAPAVPAQTSFVELELAEVRRPSAFAVVRVLARDGQPLGRVMATAASGGGATWGESDDAGYCRIGPLPPGAYYLSVDGDGAPRVLHGPVTLLADETLDCGELRERAPGSVRLRLSGCSAATPTAWRAMLVTPEAAGTPSVFELHRGEGQSPPIPPGRYRLSFGGAHGVALAQRDVEVLEGCMTELELACRAGVPVALTVQHPELVRGTSVMIAWRRETAGDALIAPADIEGRRTGVCESTWLLEPGAYTVEIVSTLGRRGTATCVVDGREPHCAVVVDLR